MHRHLGAAATVLAVALTCCTSEGDPNGPPPDGSAAADSGPNGCWVMGALARLETGVCGYSSASAELGTITVSGYFSAEHPHTCYLQTHDVDDAYDGGCDAVEATGVGSQFRVSYECDGVPYSSGWLETTQHDGYCTPDHDITACEIQARAAGC